jgi:AcrR family transcriptional regulator
MSDERPRRAHTGRRRNDAAREAILDATVDLIYNDADVTIDAIAHAAGVGRQTIYRWWPSKGAVAAEALARRARDIVPARDTGSVRDDLTAFLTDSFAGLEDENLRGALRRIAAAAQRDVHVAAVLADFTAARRAALRELLQRGQDRGELSPGADLAMLVDMAYGVLWYRVLISHAPLDAEAAKSLAAGLMAAGT